jgi:hypothetical protein
MHVMERLLLMLGLGMLLLMLIGLIKPWMLLWWRDVQNRRGVIQVYGTLSMACFLGYGLIKLMMILFC